jgi:hypothetical protein
VATTADAKGLFPEQHVQYSGYYWGSISSDATNETVEAADIVLVAGVVRGPAGVAEGGGQRAHMHTAASQTWRRLLQGRALLHAQGRRVAWRPTHVLCVRAVRRCGLTTARWATACC